MTMWINPKTGKGWTDDEEAIFAKIQACSRLNRIQAIQLYRRVNSNAAKALEIARSTYLRATEAQLAGLRLANARRASRMGGSSAAEADGEG